MKILTKILIAVSIIALIVGAIFLTIGLINTKKSNVLTTKTHEMSESFSNLNVDLIMSDLEFKVSEDGDIKVVCVEKEKVYNEVSVSDNALIIKEIDTRKFYEKIFNFSFKRTTVTVYLPAATYGNLIAKSTTGKILSAKEFNFNSISVDVTTGNVEINSNVTDLIQVETTTGKVEVNNANAKNMQIETTTGKVKLNHLNVLGKIDIEVTTGNVELNDVKSKNIEMATTTGNIKLTNVITEENITAETTTGHITFENSDAQTLNAKATTGNITGTLLTNKIFDAESEAGTVSVPQSSEGGLCKLRTTAGKINITIK